MTVFDPGKLRWMVSDGDGSTSYRIHQETSILGYDRAAGTLDMLVRSDCGGHCPAHRHVTTTSVLVLEGEQHLDDMLPGGERVHKVRTAGEYHLTTGDAHPHMERGGPEGALIFYSHHTDDGRLYELVDEDGEVIHIVTLDDLAGAWEAQG